MATKQATLDVPREIQLADLAVVRAIGNTPILRLQQIERANNLPSEVELWLKAEWTNPGGSVKDRPALGIVRDALDSGQLTPGKTLLDGTSGNMGISYAMLGAVLGFPVELVMPYSASEERKQVLTAYGVTWHLSDPDLGPEGVKLLVQEIFDADPERYFYADQSANPANPRSHFETTGPEVWEQTGGRVTHFVAGLGTTGTIMGAGQFLKQRNPQIDLVTAEAATYPHDIAGLKHLATGPIPEIYDETKIDRHEYIDAEEAFAAARHLARLEGLFVGISTGAALAAALRTGKSVTGPAVIVLIAPDNGSKYLSSGLLTTSTEQAR